FMDNLIIGSVTNSGLPIELSKFTASVSERTTTLLNWTTKSESDNAYFTVERSADGFAWTELVQIDGAGNSSQTVHYNFEDENPLSGISYYRLKQTDFNGGFTYSDVISVSIYSDENELPYPNPTTGL